MATKERDFRFTGNVKNDSILIGKYGNANLIIDGCFDLAGLIFCPGSKVELNVSGEGNIRFTGVCKELVIKGIQGDCTIDLSGITAKVVRCEVVKGNAKVLFGKIRSIELIAIDEQSIIEYIEPPAIVNHTLRSVA